MEIDKAINWRELPQGFYYISDVKPTKYGYQLFLINLQEECSYIVWSPSKINEELNKNVEYHFIDKKNKEYFHYHLGSSKAMIGGRTPITYTTNIDDVLQPCCRLSRVNLADDRNSPVKIPVWNWS